MLDEPVDDEDALAVETPDEGVRPVDEAAIGEELP
jgi:hypothetical protein